MNNLSQNSYIIFEYDSIDSTQNELKRKLSTFDFDPHVAVAVAAFHQTQGRGRQGRTWNSPPHENIYLSLGLPIPQAILSTPEVLCPLVSLAIYEYIASFGINSVKIKWPNDILIDDKKIAGILIETMTVTQYPKESSNTLFEIYAIVGVGINLNMPLEECLKIKTRDVTSIFAETNMKYGIQDESKKVIRAIMNSFQDDPLWIHSLFMKWIDKISWIKGREITTHRHDNSLLTGIVEDITNQGLLIIKDAQTGKKEVISSGL